MDSPLRKWRTVNGWTLQQVAERLGVDQSRVSRWERGRIPAERLADITRLTGLMPIDLRPDLFAISQAPSGRL